MIPATGFVGAVGFGVRCHKENEQEKERQHECKFDEIIKILCVATGVLQVHVLPCKAWVGLVCGHNFNLVFLVSK